MRVDSCNPPHGKSMKKIWISMDPQRKDIQYLVDRLKAKGFDAYAKKVSTQNREYVAEAKKVDAAIVGMEKWDREALYAIRENLGFLMRKGAGYDLVDIPAATEFGIPVMNIPGVNATAVAEMALLHILNAARQMTWTIQKQLDNPAYITSAEKFFGGEVDQATVGIIGYGSIGRELARLLSGFHTRILVYDAFYRPEPDGRIEVADSMEQVFRESDYISLHIPSLPSTQKLINMQYFRMMKPTACIINTARGQILDEDDLYTALSQGVIRFAGLDVVCREPITPQERLLELDRICITPHIAGDSVESRNRSNELIIQTCVDFFNGKVPSNIVNRDVIPKLHIETRTEDPAWNGI